MTVRAEPLTLAQGATCPAAQTADAFRDAVRAASDTAFTNASLIDHDGAFPLDDIARLTRAGALMAPLPADHGGLGIASGPLLLETLRLIDHGSLPLGRLYEGHVNALGLIQHYGTHSQPARAARDASQGLLFGVWNTDPPPGLRLERMASGWRLLGAKTFASGAGFIAYPLVTAIAEGRQFMVVPRLSQADQSRADLSSWQAHGMRASATGSFDFTDLTVEDEDIIGTVGDYHRQPAFPAAETAHLWVASASEIAAREGNAEQIIAYVNLARTAAERARLDVLELAQRAIGLAGFDRNHPIKHVFRDLATYLRQPAPDKALSDAAAHVLAQTATTGALWHDPRLGSPRCHGKPAPRYARRARAEWSRRGGTSPGR
ncbi:MAG TPA: acyl-CoA dehydrogenase family protein [Ancylobacter sp.]